MNQIELIDLSKSYDGNTNVIENINVEIKQGEFFVLVGPSGCGKSTLLRMIAGLEDITDGLLKINGKVSNHALPKDRNISMVFQNYALFPHMSVRENILFGLDVKKVSKEDQHKRLKETAEMMGLTELLNRKPGQLSGGQRQRVALARSICSHSPICLMDEPLSNLDAQLRAQMRTEIRRIQKQLGLTMIYVTHDQVEAMTMGDRIMVLNGGHIQQVGAPLTLYNNPANKFVAGFIGTPQMNMAHTVLMGDSIVLNDSIQVNIESSNRHHLPAGEEFIVGIRPENISYASGKTKTSYPVTIMNVELLGNETQIVFEVGREIFIAKWPGQWNIEIGSTIHVDFHPDFYHFFDVNSEKLIRASLQKDMDAHADKVRSAALRGEYYG
ncbi:ABC transporter ATP-binding protein [Paenibacillus sp. GP183]|jgi:sn-glycerol 3-phosphate transport system ATP-binding protein|uniref:ABC transporter ATP-binding protein n=1 Tax=Paenibacillus sp. GP183 TaxID=1882751 RepID=UPI0008996337|nr:ABC transporter ATP-binding protein [Paenibacillus sp. GP183]SEC29353.1 carbohydrate ABC transporter ATP-binding protein, CUT1 family [Paenibacillus sp. GP183]